MFDINVRYAQYFYGMGTFATCLEVICPQPTNNLSSFVCSTTTFIDFINYFTPTPIDKWPKLSLNKEFI